MRAFKFRLERILNYRHSLTERERIVLAQKIGNLVRAEEHASKLRGIRNETSLARLRALELGLATIEVRNMHLHILRIDDTIANADSDIAKAKIEVENTRDSLVKRRRDERVIELYRERKWKSWLRDYYRDESRTLDDIGTIRHVRMSKEGE